jgi:hypothetical protein
MGFGNHLRQSDPDKGFYLRFDPNLELYWLEPFTDMSNFMIGNVGAFRYAEVTSVLSIYREPGDTSLQILISVPRSLTLGTASNAVWWQAVTGNQSYGYRLQAGGNKYTSTGNAAIVGQPLSLTLKSKPGIGRSNGIDVIGGSSGVSSTPNPIMQNYPNGVARLFADGNEAQFFNGRFYGGVVTNRTENEDFCFRIERQIAEWAGLTL